MWGWRSVVCNVHVRSWWSAVCNVGRWWRSVYKFGGVWCVMWVKECGATQCELSSGGLVSSKAVCVSRRSSLPWRSVQPCALYRGGVGYVKVSRHPLKRCHLHVQAVNSLFVTPTHILAHRGTQILISNKKPSSQLESSHLAEKENEHKAVLKKITEEADVSSPKKLC